MEYSIVSSYDIYVALDAHHASQKSKYTKKRKEKRNETQTKPNKQANKQTD